MNYKEMSEEDFVYAWLLASKSGVGTAVGWHKDLMEHQVREAKRVYQYIQQEKANDRDEESV